MIPGTHLEGPNELMIKDNNGNMLWKKSFYSENKDHQVGFYFCLHVLSMLWNGYSEVL